MKPVEGFEDRYAVTDDGRVWSLMFRSRTGRGIRRPEPQQVKPEPNKRGHLRVKLYDGQRHHWRYVHALVLRAFGPKQPEGKPLVLHGNGDPTDNRIANLRWGDAYENWEDRRRHYAEEEPEYKVDPRYGF